MRAGRHLCSCISYINFTCRKPSKATTAGLPKFKQSSMGHVSIDWRYYAFSFLTVTSLRTSMLVNIMSIINTPRISDLHLPRGPSVIGKNGFLESLDYRKRQYIGNGA